MRQVPAIVSYGLATVASSTALALWLVFGTRLAPSPFLLFLAAVLLAALYGGLGPGLLATGCGVLAGLLLVVDPSLSPGTSPIRSGVQVAAFLLVGLGVTGLLTRQRRTEQALRASEASYRRLIERAQEGIWLLDAHGRTTLVNPALREMLGYQPEEMRGLPVAAVVPDDEQWIVGALRDPQGAVSREARLLGKDGRSLWALLSASSMVEEGAQRGGVLLMVTDLTARRQAEERLRRQALHDALTGLPNRTLLGDRLEHAIRTTARERGPVALFLVDLDRFKEVNDTFGHHQGDLLLKQVAARIGQVLRASDTVARLGGDEFAVILPGADRAGAVQTADRVQAALQEPMRIERQALRTGASIGIALCPEHGADPSTLLRRADVAMYVAKRTGRGHAVYDPADDQHSVSRVALIHDLEHAIAHDQLLLHFQPAMHMKTGAPGQIEALVRWQHPERGLLPPDQFIPLAEETGLIVPLTRWVLSAALEQGRAWSKVGLTLRVAVNLSARSLLDRDLVESISDTLRRQQMEASALEVEITESTLMDDPAHAMTMLAALHQQGVRITIDDFGTGYSSLAYLTRLPVDALKIDRSFVREMTINGTDTVVRSVIDLAHNLDLQVVAEGVEDEATWTMLASMDCDLTQGYFHSRPLPPAEVASWLRQRVA